MPICNKFKLDESCRKDLEDGYISKGCICCIHSGMNAYTAFFFQTNKTTGKTYGLSKEFMAHTINIAERMARNWAAQNENAVTYTRFARIELDRDNNKDR